MGAAAAHPLFLSFQLRSCLLSALPQPQLAKPSTFPAQRRAEGLQEILWTDLRSSHLANGINISLTNLKDTQNFTSAFIQSFSLAFLEINVRGLINAGGSAKASVVRAAQHFLRPLFSCSKLFFFFPILTAWTGNSHANSTSSSFLAGCCGKLWPEAKRSGCRVPQKYIEWGELLKKMLSSSHRFYRWYSSWRRNQSFKVLTLSCCYHISLNPTGGKGGKVCAVFLPEDY